MSCSSIRKKFQVLRFRTKINMALTFIPIIFAYKGSYAYDRLEQLLEKNETAIELIRQIIDETPTLDSTINNIIDIIHSSSGNPKDYCERLIYSSIRSHQLYSAIVELNAKRADFLYLFRILSGKIPIKLDKYSTKKLLSACAHDAQLNPEIFYLFFCSSVAEERLPFITKLSEAEFLSKAKKEKNIDNISDSSKT